MKYPIADLHCDLLCYLIGGVNRTAQDACVRCSIPQLKKGGVKIQVLPIFTETAPHSSTKGSAQAKAFHELTLPKEISIHVAIENASSFAEEEELLDSALKRLTAMKTPPVYISLTWNTENRFGGGAHTTVGLKSDGRELLDFMHDRHIAVDLSHTSDPLAYDILAYIDQKGLNIPIIASHSNFRAVTDVSRNLPDELAQEIFRRGGLIGLNCVRPFVGAEDPYYFVKQLEHGLSLGGEKHLCFGADFFYYGDISPQFRKTPEEYFFPDYGDSSTYATLIDLWQEHLGLSKSQIQAIAYNNLNEFIIPRINL